MEICVRIFAFSASDALARSAMETPAIRVLPRDRLEIRFHLRAGTFRRAGNDALQHAHVDVVFVRDHGRATYAVLFRVGTR